jgi:quercetin dioxygenase-like cupin family protein
MEARQAAEQPHDTSIIKVQSRFSPHGSMGQTYLASGKRLAMRAWTEDTSRPDATQVARDYETVGYVLAGKAELHIEGQVVILEPGDSWVVPRGANHVYRILEPFTAIEATSPPAHVHGRDEPSP